MKKLTLDDIKERIARIENAALYDFEVAHAEEDQLNEDFVECMAAGVYSKQYAIEVAKLIMKVRDIDFNRVCA